MNEGNSAVIELAGLTKIFRSRFHRREVCAVSEVSLRVERGHVVAFVGPNGAGKTTTIYTLLGLLHPDRGTARLFGEPAGSLAARRRTGFQSEIFHTYGFKTAEKVLHFYGELSEMPNDKLEAAVPRQLERLGLGAARTRKVRGFSKGMIQRLGIAQALLHQPELLVLDEPTTGLDPEGRKLVADLILEEKARGTTVFLSSHILSDVERTCDQIVILREGRVVLSETMEALRRGFDEWEIELLHPSAAALEAIGRADLHAGPEGALLLRCASAEKTLLLHRLLHAGIEIGFVRRARSLEDLYLQYAGGTSSG